MRARGTARRPGSGEQMPEGKRFFRKDRVHKLYPVFHGKRPGQRFRSRESGAGGGGFRRGCAGIRIFGEFQADEALVGEILPFPGTEQQNQEMDGCRDCECEDPTFHASINR